jgi:hypothetical protein
MPLVTHKKTIKDAIRDVAIAPFVFLLVNAWDNIHWLILGLILMFFSVWLAGENLAALIPTKNAVFIFLIMIVFIAVAAIPLALRDYLFGDKYQLVWTPTPGCITAALSHVNTMIAGDLGRFYFAFSPKLKSIITEKQFFCNHDKVWSKNGKPVEILDVNEIEITGEMFYNPEYDKEVDCIVQISLRCELGNKSNLLLCYNTQSFFQIVDFRLTNF